MWYTRFCPSLQTEATILTNPVLFCREKLDLVRIYTKPKGKQPDYSSPVVLRRGKSSIEDFCNNIHKDIAWVFMSLPAQDRKNSFD